MVKKLKKKLLPPSYPIRLTAVMIYFSWMGLEAFVTAGALYRQKELDDAITFLGIGAVLLVYSLVLRIRLKLRDVVPYIEQAILFYGGSFVLVPVLSALWLRFVLKKWMSANILITGASSVVLVIYLFIFAMIWFHDLPGYQHAPHNSWSRRLLRFGKQMLNREKKDTSPRAPAKTKAKTTVPSGIGPDRKQSAMK